MESLFKDDTCEIKLDVENDILYQIWIKSSSPLKEADFRDKTSVFADIVLETHASRAIINNKNLTFFIGEKTNQWMNEVLGKKFLGSSLEKVALIVSDDFWSQLGIEESTETKDKDLFENKLFSEMDRAQKWILHELGERVSTQ